MAGNVTPSFVKVMAIACILVAPSVFGFNRSVNTTSDTAAIDAAALLYGSSSLLTYSASDQAFQAAFPGLSLYAVVHGLAPMPQTHAMARDVLANRSYDVTKNFNKILADLGATVPNATKALQVGKAFAQVGNAELQTGREVLMAADSSRVNYTVADPVAGFVGGDWIVNLTTWSQENGVIANWTLRFRANVLLSSVWEVMAMGRGEFEPDIEAHAFRVGTIIENTYTGSGGLTHVLSGKQRGKGEPSPPLQNLLLLLDPSTYAYMPILGTTRTNFDGSVWQPQFTAGVPPPQQVMDLAHALAAAGQNAYGKQVRQNTASSGCGLGVVNPNPHWGFESQDDDCVLELNIYAQLTLSCGACAASGSEVRVYVAAYYEEFLHSVGLYLNIAKHNTTTIARSVVGHEHFHNLQWVITQWSPRWDTYHEGMARFSQTILDPETEDDSTSAWYATVQAPFAANGVNYFQLHPSFNICNQLYAYALYWGYLFWKDGGLGVLRRMLQEVVDERANLNDCELGITRATSDALAASAGLHDTHAEAAVDFGLHAYKKDFVWGDAFGANPRSWAAHLVDVLQIPQGLGSVPHSVDAWGMNYVRIMGTGAVEVSCSYGHDANWSFRLLRKETSGFVTSATVDCTSPTTVNPLDYAEVVWYGLRRADTSSTYTLAIAAA